MTAHHGVHPTPPHGPHPALYGLDIETDTSTGGLDPRTSAVVATAVWTPAGRHVVLGDEADVLRRTDEVLAGLPPGVFVTWNGAAFDLPFLEHRAAAAGVPLALRTTSDTVRRSAREPCRRLVRARWHRHVHLDGYQLYRADVGRSFDLPCGLKPLARLVGLQPIELDRSALHLATEDDLAAYVASDAELAVRLVARRLPGALRSTDFPLRSPLGHLGPTAEPPVAPTVARS